MQDDDKYTLSGLEFDGYQLNGKIGEGELGVVYLAVKPQSGEVAACKIMKKELSQAGVAVQQFVYEARTASKLEHPNVIKAISAGHSCGYYYLLMEYVNGVSLETLRLHEPSRLTIDFLCERFQELASALDYAWRHYLLTHGDIKPDNILIQFDPPMLKLADLGLAKVAINTPHHHNTIMGTPLYIAPELASGKQEKSSVKSDIYSFGVMFYELVCGTPPFFGSVEDVLRSHIEASPIPVREYNREIPEKLAQFISKCMAKDPQERPEDWSQVARFLRTWKIDDDAVQKTPVNKSKDAGKKLSAVHIAVMILLSLCVIAELLYIFLM